MLNKTKRLLALLMAAVMVFALAGCSKTEEDGSDEISVIYEYDYDYQEGEKNNNTTSGNNSTTAGNKNNNTSGSNNTTGGSSKVNAADYKGTHIIFASTIDPKDDGTDYVVSNFEKEYGIDVEIIVPTLDTYGSEMTNLISSGKAPTVGRSNGDAPVYVSYFDSLDVAKIDYTDEIWNQNTFKLSTYNGSPRLCDTEGNFWTEIDIVVYSKSHLSKANCPTPEELDAKGEWTFDNFLKIGQITKSAGVDDGASFHSYDCLLNMGGGTVYGLDSTNHFTNGVATDATKSVMKKVAKARKDGYLVNGSTTGLINGTVSITTVHAWALRTDGALKSHSNYNDIGFYYLPAYEKGGERPVTGLFRGWGIFKGCNDNPATGSKAAVAGGLFLRYYLDVNNYDLDKSFISEEAKTFFFKVTSLYCSTDNYNPYLTTYKLNTGVSGLDDDTEVYNIMNGSVDVNNVEGRLTAATAAVEKAVNNLNTYIDNSLNANN